MANITNSFPVVTEDKLKDFYEDIKPFLGCPAYLTSEGNAEYYSTDEKVIGRWINGKPLYQKVWANQDTDIILPTNDWVSASNISLNNVEELINCFIVSNQLTSDNAYYQFNFAYGWSKTNNCLMIQNTRSTNNSLGVDGRTYNVILRYTKTTDSAATTIQEDPNEYSIDEKIIGKWIDGKPLYQKTITTTAPTVATAGTYVTTTVAHGASNVDVIFTPCAFVKDNNNIARMMPYTINAGYQIKANPSRSGIQFTSAIKDFNGCTVYITIQYTKITD